MSLWRRVTALILMIVVAPASVLAAMPMTYCIDAQGRETVRLTLSESHHGDEAHGVHAAEIQLSDGPSLTAAGDGCRDAALLGALRQAPSVNVKADSQPIDAHPTNAIHSGAVETGDFTPAGLADRWPVRPSSAGVDPRICAQRVVVLRI